MRRVLLTVVALLLLCSEGWAQAFVRYYPPSGLVAGSGGSWTATGPILLPDGTAAAPGLAFATETGLGIYRNASGSISFSLGSSGRPQFNMNYGTSIFQTLATGAFGWNSGTNAINGVTDVLLYRDAANTLALRNLTAAQAFNIYNTTDAGVTNYERGTLDWNGNIFRIGTAAGGTGTIRDTMVYAVGGNIYLRAGGAAVSGMRATAGTFYSETTDEDTLGAAANVWQHLYLSRAIQGYKTKTLADASPTAFVRIALPQTYGSNFTSGTILWQLHCDNGTTGTYADRAGQTVFTCNNISGTEACVFDSTAQQVTQAATYSYAAPAFTATGGTDTVDINVNGDCGGVVGPATHYIHYRLDILDPQTVTPQ